jgi:hypothetical protein
MWHLVGRVSRPAEANWWPTRCEQNRFVSFIWGPGTAQSSDLNDIVSFICFRPGARVSPLNREAGRVQSRKFEGRNVQGSVAKRHSKRTSASGSRGSSTNNREWSRSPSSHTRYRASHRPWSTPEPVPHHRPLIAFSPQEQAARCIEDTGSTSPASFRGGRPVRTARRFLECLFATGTLHIASFKFSRLHSSCPPVERRNANPFSYLACPGAEVD